MSASSHVPQTRFGRAVDQIEETFIALCLGAMTLVTFANVVARYVFSTNILWALEVTVFLFAWLILIGMSYGVKKHLHIGVDLVIAHLSPPVKKVVGIIAALICLAFALLLLKGSWDYWWPFADPNQQSWYETKDIPMPDWLRFIEPLINQGESYEKLPRFIPYFALPLGCALLTLRFAQAAIQIIRGQTDRLIASHEAEELMEELEQYGGAGQAKQAAASIADPVTPRKED